MKRLVMDDVAIRRAINKIAKAIMDENGSAKGLVLVGTKGPGETLAKHLCECIKQGYGRNVSWWGLDVTYIKDNISSPLLAGDGLMVNVVNKTVILVDDTITSGRTAQAAISAILSHGRAKVIKLAVLVDCGHRELPLQPDYIGKNIPTEKSEKIKVDFTTTPNAVYVK